MVAAAFSMNEDHHKILGIFLGFRSSL